MAVATVGGPLLGGLLVDTRWLGLALVLLRRRPLRAVALVLLQRTLHLPVIKRKCTSITWRGVPYRGVSALLIWVTLAGDHFACCPPRVRCSWPAGSPRSSPSSSRAAGEGPIVPLRLFRDRTTTLASSPASRSVVAMFGSSVLPRSVPAISAATRRRRPACSHPDGRRAAALLHGLGHPDHPHGRWKHFLVAGLGVVFVGFGLLSVIDHETNMVLLGGFLFVLGVGIGMTMQNLVLAVQNTVAASDLGAASSAVAFFRSLGGTIGVSVLGAVLSSRVGDLIRQGLAGIPGARAGRGVGRRRPGDLADAPPAIQTLIRVSYGDATGRIFLVSAVIASVALVAILSSARSRCARRAASSGCARPVDARLTPIAGSSPERAGRRPASRAGGRAVSSVSVEAASRVMSTPASALLTGQPALAAWAALWKPSASSPPPRRGRSA
jgi:hypothetical protein